MLTHSLITDDEWENNDDLETLDLDPDEDEDDDLMVGDDEEDDLDEETDW